MGQDSTQGARVEGRQRREARTEQGERNGEHGPDGALEQPGRAPAGAHQADRSGEQGAIAGRRRRLLRPEPP